MDHIAHPVIWLETQPGNLTRTRYWRRENTDYGCVPSTKYVRADIADALLAALKAMVEPFAMMTDDILREYPDTPQPRNILAARAAISAAEGASS
jgi:hypothetical protein